MEFVTFILHSRLVSDKHSSFFIQLLGSVSSLRKKFGLSTSLPATCHSAAQCYLEIAGYKHTIHYIVFVLLVHCVCWLSGIIDGFDCDVKSCSLASPYKSSLLSILIDSINDKNVRKDT